MINFNKLKNDYNCTKILQEKNKNLQEENERLKKIIILSLHLINHYEEFDYNVFIENLEKILNGGVFNE